MEEEQKETPLVEGGQGRCGAELTASAILVGVLIAFAIVGVVILTIIEGKLS